MQSEAPPATNDSFSASYSTKKKKPSQHHPQPKCGWVLYNQTIKIYALVGRLCDMWTELAVATFELEATLTGQKDFHRNSGSDGTGNVNGAGAAAAGDQKQAVSSSGVALRSSEIKSGGGGGESTGSGGGDIKQVDESDKPPLPRDAEVVAVLKELLPLLLPISDAELAAVIGGSDQWNRSNATHRRRVYSQWRDVSRFTLHRLHMFSYYDIGHVPTCLYDLAIHSALFRAGWVERNICSLYVRLQQFRGLYPPDGFEPWTAESRYREELIRKAIPVTAASGIPTDPIAAETNQATIRSLGDHQWWSDTLVCMTRPFHIPKTYRLHKSGIAVYRLMQRDRLAADGFKTCSLDSAADEKIPRREIWITLTNLMVDVATTVGSSSGAVMERWTAGGYGGADPTTIPRCVIEILCEWVNGVIGLQPGYLHVDIRSLWRVLYPGGVASVTSLETGDEDRARSEMTLVSRLLREVRTAELWYHKKHPTFSSGRDDIDNAVVSFVAHLSHCAPYVFVPSSIDQAWHRQYDSAVTTAILDAGLSGGGFRDVVTVIMGYLTPHLSADAVSTCDLLRRLHRILNRPNFDPAMAYEHRTLTVLYRFLSTPDDYCPDGKSASADTYHPHIESIIQFDDRLIDDGMLANLTILGRIIAVATWHHDLKLRLPKDFIPASGALAEGILSKLIIDRDAPASIRKRRGWFMTTYHAQLIKTKFVDEVVKHLSLQSASSGGGGGSGIAIRSRPAAAAANRDEKHSTTITTTSRHVNYMDEKY